MIWTNMGPRGRRFRNREFRPGIMIGLLSLFFGGWIVIAVLGGILGAGVMTVSAVIHILASFFRGVFSHVFSSGGLFLGVILGLCLYYSRRKNARMEEEEETAADEADADTDIVVNHFMFHN